MCCSFIRGSFINFNTRLKEVMDREAWRAATHGVAKSRARLSDWTELNWRKGKHSSDGSTASTLRTGFSSFSCARRAQARTVGKHEGSNRWWHVETHSALMSFRSTAHVRVHGPQVRSWGCDGQNVPGEKHRAGGTYGPRRPQSTAALSEAAACPSYSQILATTDELSALPITVLTGVSYK